MFKIFSIIKEIRLYIEFVKILKKEKQQSTFWARKNLRMDNLNRVYTVVNLPAQLILSPDLPKDVRPSFVVNEIKPINEYFKSINLHELLTMWVKPIDGTDEESYLVVYQFLFRHITLLRIFRILLELFVIIVILINWDSISKYLHLS